MNVRTESRWPDGPFADDFVVGVDEWDFHLTGLSWHAHQRPEWSECSFGRYPGAAWKPTDRRQPTDEQFNFARSFLSLTQ